MTVRGASESRQARVREMLSQRLGSVAVIAEAVHRRHNTSAILRSCEAFGVHHVHLVTGTFRVSRGAARGAEGWLDLHHWTNVADAIAALQADGFRVYAADVGRDAHSPETVPVSGPIAVLLGNELSGVSDEARALVDGFVTVPMFGMMESLNVSVAAACTIQRIATRRRELVGADLSQAAQDAFFDRWLSDQEAAAAGLRARTAPTGS